MVDLTFGTEKADYVLQLGEHTKQYPLGKIEGVDALVLENAGELTHVGLTAMLVFGSINPQQGSVIEYAEEKRIPLFIVDTPLTWFAEVRSIAQLFLDLPFIFLAEMYNSYGKDNSSVLERFLSGSTFLLQDPIVEGRNAINALKIEEFVAPYLAEMIGKERPRIGMVYGTGHIGLKRDLQSKRRRDFTLFNWGSLNFGRWAGFEKDSLNRVYEARAHGPGLWEIIEHKTDLLKF